jgi:hypothetical protein
MGLAGVREHVGQAGEGEQQRDAAARPDGLDAETKLVN